MKDINKYIYDIYLMLFIYFLNVSVNILYSNDLRSVHTPTHKKKEKINKLK